MDFGESAHFPSPPPLFFFPFPKSVSDMDFRIGKTDIPLLPISSPHSPYLPLHPPPHPDAHLALPSLPVYLLRLVFCSILLLPFPSTHSAAQPHCLHHRPCILRCEPIPPNPDPHFLPPVRLRHRDLGLDSSNLLGLCGHPRRSRRERWERRRQSDGAGCAKMVGAMARARVAFRERRMSAMFGAGALEPNLISIMELSRGV